MGSMLVGVIARIIAFVALAIARPASAQPYPNRPIRLVVAQSAGGNADFVARTYSHRLAERLGQQIVVDNRPGGAGIISPRSPRARSS